MHLAVNHFRGSSRKPTSAELAEVQRLKWFIAAKDEQERKEKQEERAEKTDLDLATAVEMTIATEVQIEAFHEKLDKYDEATIRALMENEKALEIIQTKMDELLSRAHRLEDGQRVFDEFGTELDRETIDPNTIDDNAPRWEAYQPLMLEEARLEAQRASLIEFQDKLDDARERSSQEDFTVEELESLEAELEADMPPSVAQFLPADMQPAATPTMKSDYEAVAPKIADLAPQAGMSRATAFTPMN